MRGMNPSALQSMFQANHMGKAGLYDNQGGKMKKKQPMMLHSDPSILGTWPAQQHLIFPSFDFHLSVNALKLKAKVNPDKHCDDKKKNTTCVTNTPATHFYIKVGAIQNKRTLEGKSMSWNQMELNKKQKRTQSSLLKQQQNVLHHLVTGLHPLQVVSRMCS